MPVSNPNQWAAGVAQRLKMIQSNWAEEELQVRREYLHDEIARSIEDLSSADRAICLEALMKQFPQGISSTMEMPAMAAEPTVRQPATVKEACAQLTALLRNASDEDKEFVCNQLQANGISVATAGDQEGEALDIGPEMIRKLRLKPGTVINSSRVTRLMIHLLESVLSVDDLVWNLWQKIAPNSSVRRKGRADLRYLVGTYLTNSPSVSFSDVTSAVELSRRVNTSLLGAMGPLGKNFAQKYLQKYSPEAINAAVDLEGGGGFLKAKAVLCWQKYDELSSDLNEQTISNLLFEILANYAEELIMGPKAWQQTRNPFS